MKRILYITIALFFTVSSCNDDGFLDVDPQGALDFGTLTNEEGIFGLLVSAYSALDGVVGTAGATGNAWRAAASNWVYGDVASDDAYKGTDFGDQLPMNDIERMEHDPSNVYFNSKWGVVYDGVSRSNAVLTAIELAGEDMDPSAEQLFAAEARFLRAHYHFEAKRMWNMVPFVDENTDDFRQPNDRDIWPDIEADLEFAIQNLPDEQDQVGRATRGTAQAVLAKAHMYQQDFAAAKPLLDDLINSGRYKLVENFNELFRAATDNNSESIFTVQNSVNDGANDGGRGSINGNFGNVLNFPHSGSPFGCCGFHQPSFNLVNAYQTSNGLPLLDSFNDQDVKNDMGLASSQPFTEHAGPLDPRLDWTVGRRGIPYLGWGEHPGQNWIRDQSFGGPYSPKKHAFSADEKGSASTTSGWATTPNAINTPLIRLADVILWRAEVAVEEGDLDLARELVNRIRARAANSVVTEEDEVTPAANYVINEYPSGHPAFTTQEEARKAVRFERRLELAIEGHRFFDLVRWGIAEEVLNEFYVEESISSKKPFLAGARFTPNKNEFYPIPLTQIIDSSVDGAATLIQNPGY